ncbi:hypothetical protein Ancab_000134 [Ancistrocladus abbreviatus]
MAPSRTAKRKKTKATRVPVAANRRITRSVFRQQMLQQQNNQGSSSLKKSCSESSTASFDRDDLSKGDVACPADSCCSTPKGEKHRIPEIQTCPPAPRKQRVVSSCSLRRSPIAFFAHPDLEIFFMVALRDVKV